MSQLVRLKTTSPTVWVVAEGITELLRLHSRGFGSGRPGVLGGSRYSRLPGLAEPLDVRGWSPACVVESLDVVDPIPVDALCWYAWTKSEEEWVTSDARSGYLLHKFA